MHKTQEGFSSTLGEDNGAAGNAGAGELESSTESNIAAAASTSSQHFNMASAAVAAVTLGANMSTSFDMFEAT